ncbi:CYFA0S14e02938g1_1 [Cyberlindnera fabianii]|uniref:CYFA0S14e02938g1_1 n=1 Tax=Cyberlindnera fabianii TaxID=36022 RepID=A0A061B4P7_CYBFA|nr:Protein LUC7 [Cyberlindnera fabianii]CDR44462.1 CYFA0S14e02938g1_1 [Cyberlindnera fabianii]
MARYEQRQLLEQLMGRDMLIKPQSQRREISMMDQRVCKPFLMGICPYDLFSGTKQDMGRCRDIHLEKHKLQYNEQVKQGKEFPEFEHEVVSVLNRFVADCNRKIDVALKRLEPSPEEQEKITTAAKDLELMEARINIMTQEIEKLIELGEVTKAIEQGVKLEEMNVKREFYMKKLRSVTDNVGQSQQQKLQVCEVCGAYLSRLDTDRRLSDHYLGKVHLGYVQMRAMLKELKGKRRW